MFDGRRPEVLLELAFPFKSKYPSFLEIELNFFEKPSNKYKPTQIVDIVWMHHYSWYPWEQELGLKPFTVSEKDDFDQINFKKKLKEKDPEERLKYIAWERSKNESSLRPKTFLWKWETDRLGCFRLKFSHSGSFLAAACTMLDSWTIIKIFQVETG